MHFLRMPERNQGVSLSMYKESRTTDLLYGVYISESITNNVREETACLFFDYISNAHEWRHQEQGTWFPTCGQVSSRSRTNGSPKYYNGLLRHSPGHSLLCDVVIDCLCIYQYLFSICLTLINSISWVLYC
jgi:hypothetical protein